MSPLFNENEVNKPIINITDLVAKQRAFFQSNATKKVSFRKKQLTKLFKLLQKHETDLLDALYQDLRKHEFEAYSTEYGLVMKDLQKAINKVEKWAAPQFVSTPLFQFKADSYLQAEPYGNTLIIGPWNYPVQLIFMALTGAIAAGNTAIIKPSEYAVATSKIIAKIINENFDSKFLYVVEGAVEETQALLKEKFDYIFFTGSVGVGKIVYKAAAEHLTPVTLELGGKSPCIVDSDTHLNYTARRLVWGKLTNVGQTCIAPDYLLVDRKIKDKLVAKIKECIKQFYGENPQTSTSYGRIINEKNLNRLVNYLKDGGDIIAGGQYDKDDLYLAPTLVDNVKLASPLMQEEIFGPILPIIAYDSLDEVTAFIKERAKPLALYIFSRNQKNIDKILSETSAGGVTVNDTLMHIVNAELPFGGVGDSGIGAYHGKHSFDTFSHIKPVLHRSFLIEEPIRYAPYNKLDKKWLKHIFDWTL